MARCYGTFHDVFDVDHGEVEVLDVAERNCRQG